MTPILQFTHPFLPNFGLYPRCFLAWVYDPIIPPFQIAALAVLLLVATIYVYLTVSKRLSLPKRLSLLAFRLLACALLILILLQPSKEVPLPPDPTQKLTLVALDTSRSMQQPDVEQSTRLDSAKALLEDTGWLTDHPSVRLFEINDDATELTAASARSTGANGRSTRIHTSVKTMVSTLAVDEEAEALILLSDGHDFELMPAAKTAFFCRTRNIPIYAHPLGSLGKARDASIRMANYQPYGYVDQNFRLSGIVRIVGCEYETLNIDLLRNEKIVQSKTIQTGEESEMPVEFTIKEPETGFYEYQLNIRPVDGESESQNNQAVSFLNVVDRKIRVLLLEGSPYWDTTFLMRSLARNDKIEMEAVIHYKKDRSRVIRNTEIRGDLELPEKPEDFTDYDIVVLGKEVENILSHAQIAHLNAFVNEHRGTLVFARGRAWTPDVARELEPIEWEEGSVVDVKLQLSSSGKSQSPFRIFKNPETSLDLLPNLIGTQRASGVKTLTDTLAEGEDPGGESAPGIVHRRFGNGQVLGIGLAGVWKWALNANTPTSETNLYDRFWDQLVIWLLSRSDSVPSADFAFRINTSNVSLGENVLFRLSAREPKEDLTPNPVELYFEGTKLTDLILEPKDDHTQFTASYLPENTGRYRAVTTFPNGDPAETRFIVYREELEITDVATDINYLTKLSDLSGGHLITDDDDLKTLAKAIHSPTTAEGKSLTKLKTLWDSPWILFWIAVLFAADWFLRRRWGLS